MYLLMYAIAVIALRISMNYLFDNLFTNSSMQSDNDQSKNTNNLE